MNDLAYKCAERPFVIDNEELVGAQDTSSSSNSIADSTNLDGTLCTTLITPSSSKNDLEGDDDGFDYNAILDSNNVEWRVCLADVNQHKATPNCPCDSSSLSKPLQSQIGQDDSASISYNGSGAEYF